MVGGRGGGAQGPVWLQFKCFYEDNFGNKFCQYDYHLLRQKCMKAGAIKYFIT